MQLQHLGLAPASVRIKSLIPDRVGAFATMAVETHRPHCSLWPPRSSDPISGTSLLQRAQSATASNNTSMRIFWNGCRQRAIPATVASMRAHSPFPIASRRFRPNPMAQNHSSSVTRLAARLQPYTAPWHLKPSAVLCSSERRYASSQVRANSAILSCPWFRQTFWMRSQFRARFFRI